MRRELFAVEVRRKGGREKQKEYRTRVQEKKCSFRKFERGRTGSGSGRQAELRATKKNAFSAVGV